MQSLIDIINSFTSMVRFIFGLFILCMLGIGLMLTVGASYVAPKVAETFADRAEKMGDKAIQAAQEEARNKAYAKEGWGYTAGSRSASSTSDWNEDMPDDEYLRDKY